MNIFMLLISEETDSLVSLIKTPLTVVFFGVIGWFIIVILLWVCEKRWGKVSTRIFEVENDVNWGRLGDCDDYFWTTPDERREE